MNGWNKHYVDEVAREMKLDQDQVVECMLTAYQAMHRAALTDKSRERFLSPFTREVDGSLMTGRDLGVYLGALYRHDEQADIDTRLQVMAMVDHYREGVDAMFEQASAMLKVVRANAATRRAAVSGNEEALAAINGDLEILEVFVAKVDRLRKAQ